MTDLSSKLRHQLSVLNSNKGYAAAPLFALGAVLAAGGHIHAAGLQPNVRVGLSPKVTASQQTGQTNVPNVKTHAEINNDNGANTDDNNNSVDNTNYTQQTKSANSDNNNQNEDTKNTLNQQVDFNPKTTMTNSNNNNNNKTNTNSNMTNSATNIKGGPWPYPNNQPVKMGLVAYMGYGDTHIHFNHNMAKNAGINIPNDQTGTPNNPFVFFPQSQGNFSWPSTIRWRGVGPGYPSAPFVGKDDSLHGAGPGAGAQHQDIVPMDPKLSNEHIIGYCRDESSPTPNGTVESKTSFSQDHFKTIWNIAAMGYYGPCSMKTNGAKWGFSPNDDKEFEAATQLAIWFAVGDNSSDPNGYHRGYPHWQLIWKTCKKLLSKAKSSSQVQAPTPDFSVAIYKSPNAKSFQSTVAVHGCGHSTTNHHGGSSSTQIYAGNAAAGGQVGGNAAATGAGNGAAGAGGTAGAAGTGGSPGGTGGTAGTNGNGGTAGTGGGNAGGGTQGGNGNAGAAGNGGQGGNGDSPSPNNSSPTGPSTNTAAPNGPNADVVPNGPTYNDPNYPIIIFNNGKGGKRYIKLNKFDYMKVIAALTNNEDRNAQQALDRMEKSMVDTAHIKAAQASTLASESAAAVKVEMQGKTEVQREAIQESAAVKSMANAWSASNAAQSELASAQQTQVSYMTRINNDRALVNNRMTSAVDQLQTMSDLNPDERNDAYRSLAGLADNTMASEANAKNAAQYAGLGTNYENDVNQLMNHMANDERQDKMNATSDANSYLKNAAASFANTTANTSNLSESEKASLDSQMQTFVSGAASGVNAYRGDTDKIDALLNGLDIVKSSLVSAETSEATANSVAAYTSLMSEISSGDSSLDSQAASQIASINSDNDLNSSERVALDSDINTSNANAQHSLNAKLVFSSTVSAEMSESAVNDSLGGGLIGSLWAQAGSTNDNDDNNDDNGADTSNGTSSNSTLGLNPDLTSLFWADSGSASGSSVSANGNNSNSSVAGDADNAAAEIDGSMSNSSTGSNSNASSSSRALNSNLSSLFWKQSSAPALPASVAKTFWSSISSK